MFQAEASRKWKLHVDTWTQPWLWEFNRETGGSPSTANSELFHMSKEKALTVSGTQFINSAVLEIKSP